VATSGQRKLIFLVAVVLIITFGASIIGMCSQVASPVAGSGSGNTHQSYRPYYQSLSPEVATPTSTVQTVSTSTAPPSNWTAHPLYMIEQGTSYAYSPGQIRMAYNLPSSGGTGTIAIIDAYNDSTAQSDLNTFSSYFGLPTANFEIHPMSSSISSNSDWALETSLDIEWAHAIAPNAKILLVEASSNSLSDLMSAVSYAAGRSDVVSVSMSWGGSEFAGEQSYDQYFTSTHGVVFFASSGDDGAGVIYPAASPNVIGVGGTTLNFVNGQFSSETAWSGSGGGYSAYETEPTYQQNAGISDPTGMRAVPDVSYDANPSTGVGVYDSLGYNGQSGWFQVGGTSMAAPQWAAIQSLGMSVSLNTIYSDYKSSPSSYFRDIVSGSNGGYSATVGYDLVTGVGSPITTNFGSSSTPPAPPAPTAPSAPQNLVATAGNKNVALSWSAPSSNGGSSITSYNVYRGTSSGSESLLTTTTSTSYTDTGLTNGVTYYYTVAAVNSVGTSSQSNEASATPSAPSSGSGSGALVVKISTDRSVYTSYGFGTMTTTVTNNAGNPIVGASVNIVVYGPNNVEYLFSGTTNTNGVFTTSFWVDYYLPGSYTVASTATAAGYSQGTGYATYTIS